MTIWQYECFEDYLHSLHFKVKDAGPLLSPVREFTVTRNDRLSLILETLVVGTQLKNCTQDHPVGTVRLANDKVEFVGHGGMRCTAIGVSFRSQSETWDAEHIKQTKQKAKVQSLTALVRPDVAGVYTIDWLENLDKESGIWIGSIIKDHQQTTDKRTFGYDDRVELAGGENVSHTVTKRVLEMVIGGLRLYLCSAAPEYAKGRAKPGYILYCGTPDEDERKKIREILSYCLGNYLVYLGSTTLGEKSELVGFCAVSPPSIGRIYDVVSQPPAPLGYQYQFEVNQQTLERMANAIYAHFDELRFSSFSWAYWHAMCAPVHMAAVHFGAALEALQKAYMSAHAKKFVRTLIADPVWKPLQEKFLAIIDDSSLEPELRKILINKVTSNLNQIPPGMLWEKIFEDIGIMLGAVETAAWKRRNQAAHGGAVDNDSAIPIIRDTKILKIIVHRIILKITGASDYYNDDYTIGHAVRKVADPIPV